MSYVETYYSGTDFGNYSLLNNYIYKKQNDLVNTPTNYYANPDNDKKNINYSSITMDYDDNGIKGGTDHNVYTPEESYIILESVPKLSEVPSVRYTLFGSRPNENTVEFTIPCDGILRYNIDNAFNSSKDTLTKNDIKIDVTITAGWEFNITGLPHSFPINVNKNDVIKIVRNTGGDGMTCCFYFLPYVYPWE